MFTELSYYFLPKFIFPCLLAVKIAFKNMVLFSNSWVMRAFQLNLLHFPKLSAMMVILLTYMQKLCFFLEAQEVKNEFLAVECCAGKAFMKVNGEITAEKERKAAGCFIKDEKRERNWRVASGDECLFRPRFLGCPGANTRNIFAPPCRKVPVKMERKHAPI